MKRSLKERIKYFDQRTRFFRSLHPRARVLDLGCGEGNNGNKLRAIAPEVELHGVDIIPKKFVPDFYKYRTVDLDKKPLPYKDAFFDAIVLTHVIEHLRSPLSLGPEIKRVLKPGGLIYVEAPNWTAAIFPSFGFHREQHNRYNFYDDPTHLKPWTKQGIFELLYQFCELEVVRVGSVRNWVRVPLDLLVIPFGFLTGNSTYVVSSYWNLFSWCIYGIGKKQERP